MVNGFRGTQSLQFAVPAYSEPVWKVTHHGETVPRWLNTHAHTRMHVTRQAPLNHIALVLCFFF